ncbi:MAG TPA: DinB family protein [Fodinibius sp.]|nr:DinB family protein [Fodinibius sp.]
MAHLDWDENIPKSTEYADYYEGYIELITEANVIQQLIQQGQQVYALIGQLDDQQADYRYAEEKWSVKEVIGHLIDTERIMAFRALCVARGEQQSLPGFDQDEYVRQAWFSKRSLQSLAAEYDAQRNANISLFSSFNTQQIGQAGTADGSDISVRALAYIIAGHERHHLRILEERYGVSF